MKNNSFLGKICVVTSGAKGIGRRIVEAFARYGCNVAFMDIDYESGKRFQQYLQTDYGVDAFFFHGDICSAQDLDIFGKAIIGQYGKIDYLINNACICRSGLVNEKYLDEVSLALRVALSAPHILIKTFEGCFNKEACIINISPRIESGKKEEEVLYQEFAVSVHDALITLTKAIAKRFQGKVRVNCISPGIRSEENTNRLVADRFDVSNATLFLCEKKAAFINGADIEVNGGMSRFMVCHGKDGWSFLKKK